MDLVYDYFSLLPDLNNVLLSFAPMVSYFAAVKFYSYFHQGKKEALPENIESSSKNMIASTPANIFLSYPLFNYFSHIEGISFVNIMIGIFIIDTMEYFFHLFFHRNKVFYNSLHNVHHRPVPMTPQTSFTNHDGEIFITSPVILLVFVFSSLSFLEYIIVTALSFSATVSDHTVTSNKKFHYIHHHVNKNKNLQQPFFTYWDHIFGTYHKDTDLKIPFVP
jgi:sterol desaturase/sphingolipid hydroxylase (fatty acid hydroxylase superfamily)